MSNQGYIIALVGFSGIGKSHLATQLSRSYGWKSFCCDDMIEDGLRREHELPVERGIRGVADWLGFPDEEGFADRERAYLHREDEVMMDLVRTLEAARGGSENIVLDASGSLVYCQQRVIDAVCRVSKVVYLQAEPEDQKHLLELYLRDPKPLIWLNHFSKVHGESQREAIARCFPILCEDRRVRYENMARQVIHVSVAKRSLTPERFLEAIQIKDHDEIL